MPIDCYTNSFALTRREMALGEEYVDIHRKLHRDEFWRELSKQLPVGQAFVMWIEEDEDYDLTIQAHVITYTAYIETDPYLPRSPLRKGEPDEVHPPALP